MKDTTSGQCIDLHWLHELTLLGYQEGYIISATDADKIEQYYREGKTPEEAWAAARSEATIFSMAVQ